MASIPSAFPVWLVGPSGESVLVLDVNSYNGAVAMGAAPYSAVTPSATVNSVTAVAELPLSPIQAVPVMDSTVFPAGDL